MTTKKRLPRLLAARRVAAAVLACCALASCASDDAIDGRVWISQGYGYVLHERGSTLSLFHHAGDTCFVDPEVSNVEATPDSLGIQILADGDAVFADSTATIRFEAAESLPAACRPDALIDAQASPETTFDIVWANVATLFPFLAEQEVDWTAAAEARSRVVDEASLFSELANILRPLDDGHMVLEAPGESLDPAIERLQRILEPQFLAQDQTENFYEFLGAAIEANVDTIFGAYVEPLGSAGNERIYYGTIGDLGYILVLDMMGYSRDVDELLEAASDWSVSASLQNEEIEAAGLAIDEALTALSKTDGLIIDVRFNGGGIDSVSRALASRFANSEQLGYSKRPWHPERELPAVDYRIEPSARTYNKPVRVLTSPITASGAEVFLLMMRSLDHVALIGQRSLGALSDALTKPLPMEGWSLTLSTETYYSSEGEVFEFSGVPVATEVEVFVTEELLADPPHDAVLEEAILQLTQNSVNRGTQSESDEPKAVWR